ncbi:MAG: methyltransferase [Gemmatimonadota bacterium]|nr:methyltransferase [Gemmatimonadota bacterium]
MRETTRTTVGADRIGDLAPLRLEHPADTFAPTPATLIALEAIHRNRGPLVRVGLDWGSGIGALAILAARLPAVRRVIGLEIESGNVEVARRNARLNGVQRETYFMRSDSYRPVRSGDRELLEETEGDVEFLLANPPASEGDDGFGYRREVLRGAGRFLREGGVVFLSVSWQYGEERVERLTGLGPGWAHRGPIATTGWVPFDQSRANLRSNMETYAGEEERGGLSYRFRTDPDDERTIGAREALERYREAGESPLTRWQVHLFERA